MILFRYFLFLLTALALSVSAGAQSDGGATTEEDILIGLNANQLDGSGSVLSVRQIGDSNRSIVSQFGAQQAAVAQEGTGNNQQVALQGYANILNSLQKGNDNYFYLDLNGADNYLQVLQDGNNNYLSKTYSYVDGMNMYVEQQGNANTLSIDLTESANGAELPSSIIQKDGGNVHIKSLSDFSNFKNNGN